MIGHRSRAEEAFAELRHAAGTATIKVLMIGINELIQVYREEMDDATQDVVVKNQYAIAQLKALKRTIESKDINVLPKI